MCILAYTSGIQHWDIQLHVLTPSRVIWSLLLNILSRTDSSRDLLLWLGLREGTSVFFWGYVFSVICLPSWYLGPRNLNYRLCYTCSCLTSQNLQVFTFKRETIHICQPQDQLTVCMWVCLGNVSLVRIKMFIFPFHVLKFVLQVLFIYVMCVCVLLGIILAAIRF